MPIVINDTSNGSIRTNETNPPRHLPFHTEITEQMELCAHRCLGETPEKREQCLAEIREKLKNEVNLRYPDGDAFLLKFLRSRKFDVSRAFDMIKKYYKFIDANRYIFDKYNPTAVERCIQDHTVTFLPYRDKNRKAILLVRAEGWDVATLTPGDMIFGSMVALFSAVEMPVNQVTGFIVIIDVKNLSLRQIFALCPKYLLFAVSGLQYCCPCMVSAIHIVNVPEAFRMIWNIAKPILAEKVRSRVVIHQNDAFEGLHNFIPKAILPEELGGNLGPIDNILWAKDVDMLHNSFSEEMSYGYENSRLKKSRECILEDPEFETL